jgi:hypothetical protein
LESEFGDVYRQWALQGNSDTKRESYLKDASRHYEAALAGAHRDKGSFNPSAPGQLSALVGLALVQKELSAISQKGQSKELKEQANIEPIIRRLQSQASAQTLLTVGDMFQAAREPELARLFYQQAAGANPEFTEPRSRLIRMQAAGDDGKNVNGVQLAGFLSQFDVRFPNLAREGYAWGMERLESEELLIHWVSVMGENGWLTPQSLKELPPEWNAKAVIDLRQALSDPTHVPKHNWWVDKAAPRAAFGRFALKRARMLVEDEQFRQAMALLEAAISYYPTNTVDGERVELQCELALLHSRTGNPQRGIEQMQFLINTVKSPSFQWHKHEGQRRVMLIGLHSALGLALASAEPEQYSKWAQQHLQEAVSIAEEEQRKGVYYPIPDAKEALYRILKRDGNTVLALSTALDAAKSFFDTDRLSDGMEMIAELEALAASQPDTKWQRSAGELRKIAASRSGASEHSEADGWDDGEWILDRRFLRTQKFKLHADLASIAQGRGEWHTAHREASLAFEIVINEIFKSEVDRSEFVKQSINTLQGARDLLRVETLMSVLLDQFPVEKAGINVYWGAYGSGQSGKDYYNAWHLCLTNDTRLARVDVSLNAGIAAVVSSLLGWNRNADGVVFLRLLGDRTLEAVTLNKWSSDRVRNALHKAYPYKGPAPSVLKESDIY